MANEKIPPPAIGSPSQAWVDWVNACYPYRQREFYGPRELYPLLSDMPDRELAALAAEQWFRASAKQRAVAPRVPAQPKLDLGKDWEP
jgi:hypothetical protein